MKAEIKIKTSRVTGYVSIGPYSRHLHKCDKNGNIGYKPKCLD